MAQKEILVDLLIDGDATADSFIKDGGTSTQFLKADGSIDSSTYLTSVVLPNAGIGAGTYGATANATKIDNITVDAQGRVTAVTTGLTGDVTANNSATLTNKSGSNSQWTNDQGYVTSSDITWGNLNGNQDDIVLSDFDDDLSYVGGSGTDNTIAMFNGSTNVQNSVLTQLASGNIGLAASNPLGRLDIEGMSTTVPALKVNAGGGDNLIMDIYNSSNVKRMGLEYDNSNIRFNITDRNTAKLFTVQETGNVGIGDDTPSFKLDVAGAIRATGDITAFSDARVKENVLTIENALDKVSRMRGVRYNRIGEDELSIGVIAQEVERVIPEVVHTDPKGMKSVAYGNIVGLLIESIKELKDEIEELKNK